MLHQMERKMNNASSKLRNLKEFLSSTRSVNTTQSQLHLNQNVGTHQEQMDNNFNKGAGYYRKTPKNAISLFNLVSSTTKERKKVEGQSGRPISAAFDDCEPYGFPSPPNKSISMFGLSQCDDGRSNEFHRHGRSDSRNIAARLFYNIRSKFRRRRRERNKIVDSKSTEFGSFLGESLQSPTSRYSDGGDTACHSLSARYPLKSSTSVDNVLESLLKFGSRRSKSCNENIEPCRLVITHPRFNDTELCSSDNNYEECDNVFDDDLPQNTIPTPNTLSISAKSGCSSGASVSPNVATLSPAKPLKCLTKELEDLLHYGWYWAGLSKEESEAKLKGQPDGAFVVRDSSSDHYLLSLSFNCNGRTLHTRIEYRNGQFSFYSSDADSFPTVAELIEHCLAYSELGVFCYSRARRSDYPSYPVRLTKPISRFTEVKSLLYLSRFVLRQYVRLDLIPQLPLPQSLIEFVSEQRYI